MDPLVALPQFELKYCERCAALWLRPKGTITRYCPACEPFVAELPMSGLRKLRTAALRTYVPTAVSLLVMLVAGHPEFFRGWLA